MELYTNAMCPYAQRVAIAVGATRANAKMIEVNLYGSSGITKKDICRLEKEAGLEPIGYIPILRIQKKVIRESIACVQYLFPGAERQEIFDEIEIVLRKEGKRLVLSGAKSSKLMDTCLSQLDASLTDDSFLFESTEVGIADCCLLPFLWRIDQALDLRAALFPKLKKYLDRMLQEPYVKPTLTSTWWWWW